MAQPQRMEASRPQREQFRESFADAMDGIDVRELHTGRPTHTPAPRAPWSPTSAMLPTQAAAVPAAAPAPPPPTPIEQGRLIRAHVDAAVAPLLAEIVRLRTEVARLQDLPKELSRNRRSDMLIIGGLMLVAFAIAGILLGPVLHP